MDYKTIRIEPGPITRVKLDRPERGNSLNGELIAELTDALWQLDGDPQCRVIVLEGEGKGFCSGGDLGNMGSDPSIMDARAGSRALPKLLTAMTKIGKLVIAKVHGYALAGGFGLAVNCDLVVVSETAKLGTPEILRALFPFMITAPISRCMPFKKMVEMCFTGERITPAQALDYGIVNYVVPEPELEAKVLELAGQIARHSPAAIRLGKEAIYAQRDMEYHKALDYLSECLTTIKQTRDAKEGIAAFLEKRDPVWEGK